MLQCVGRLRCRFALQCCRRARSRRGSVRRPDRGRHSSSRRRARPFRSQRQEEMTLRSDSPDVPRAPGFTYRESKLGRGRGTQLTLHAEGAPLAELAEDHGTPLYVYSSATIQHRYRAFDKAFSNLPHTVCYSVKANSNLSILRLLAKMGCGFDVVSGGELERGLAAVRNAAKKVVCSGVGKTRAELRAALKAGILLFNVESESELWALAECADQLHTVARMALRVNPDVAADTHPYISTGLRQHKFGVPIR